MMFSHRRSGRRLAVITAALAASSLFLSGCGGPGASGDRDSGVKGSPEAVDAALKKGGTITFWTWTDAKAQVKAFEKEYPNVKVKLVNAGTAGDEYTKLQNAIKAGSGAPDVAQIEYNALPQFAMPGHLVDLRKYGFDALAEDYTPSSWESAHVGDGLFGLPQDGGPMVMYYNKKLFDKHDIAAPTTWDEYLAAARKLKQADPKIYITTDTGDANHLLGMIWQAGGRPFHVDGDKVSINFNDEGTQKFTAIWNQLLQGDMLAPYADWTEQWFNALQDDTVATMVFGGWMSGVFAGLKKGKGDWRVAPMPTYDGGQPVSAQHGGSSEAVLKQSENPELAAGFLRWLNHEQGATLFAKQGGLPATNRDLNAPGFLDQKWPYFGGQEANQIVVAAANQVAKGWEFLPYQTYANSIVGDTVGKVYQSKGDLNAGLKAWQEALVKYGTGQGFQVNG
jgi:multiple sugar transport system substrate-binding protein